MLLSFSMQNWMCYKDEVTFALTSTLERQHINTLAYIPGFRSKKALPISAIYGGNSSGKTAIFQALATVKRMVTKDPGVSGLLPIKPFAIDRDSRNEPTMFDIVFLEGEHVYRLVIECSSDSISYESLELVNERTTTEIYVRDQSLDTPFSFKASFFEDPTLVGYAFKGTRGNRLFIESAVSQNVHELEEAYRWFAQSLVTVGVESQAWGFATSATQKEGFLDYAGKTLAQLDTGIVRLTGETVSIEMLPQDAELRAQARALAPYETMTVVNYRGLGDYDFEAFMVRVVDGRTVVERLRTVHVGADGVEYQLSLSEESSGTQRLMGLLPMLFDLVGPASHDSDERVYVVDELDRCLHTMLVERLIRDYLSTCGPSTRKQLLFTTHDLLLMNQSLMRRDEMYIAQRRLDGRSELIGLSEYQDIRKDKDLIKSYLEGRFGGTPMLGGVVHG